MSVINRLVLRAKRSKSKPILILRKCWYFFTEPRLPVLPRFVLFPYRLLSEAQTGSIILGRFLAAVLWRLPVFQARCASMASGCVLAGNAPYVTGPVEIHLGHRVWFGGNVFISSGAVFDNPQLIIKDRSGIGWGTSIAVNKEVLIEEDVIIAYNCNISDSDGHCREADLRAGNTRPAPKDVRPVRICRYAWVGNGSYILKGVTIGEGAIIGANSVVISNVPPYSLAMGNPAEVLIRNFGRPSTYRKKPSPSVPPAG
jgi:acetyltransferase-like isoleucine patch superfamily enzyme